MICCLRSASEFGESGEGGVEIASVPGVVGAVDKFDAVPAEHGGGAEAHEFFLLCGEADGVVQSGDGDKVVEPVFVDADALNLAVRNFQRDFTLEGERQLAERQKHELVLAELEHVEFQGEEAGDLGAEIFRCKFDDDGAVVERFEAEFGENGEYVISDAMKDPSLVF